MRRALWFLAAASALLANTATAQKAFLPSMGGGDLVMPVTSIRQARLAGTLLQQYDFSCGSAAVATLLTHHFGYPMSEATVFDYMFRNGNQKKIRTEGFSLLDMKRFLQAHGFEADGFEQPLDKLAEAKAPAIVLINENGYQHFVVIKGLRGDRVLLGDPAHGTRAVSRANFMESWQNGLLFVVHNRMESARFNLAEDWKAVPQAPLTAGVNRNSLSGATMPKHGPGDF
jgi:uncharacterized protein